MKRLTRIRELLRTDTVRSQEELAERLELEGFAATQSAISRDLKELGVAKIKGSYQVVGDEEETDLSGISEAIRRVVTAGPNLIVVGTAVGLASRVGFEVDRAQWAEVRGTIAGDDTVFIAVANAKAQQKVIRRLKAAQRKGRS